MSKFKKLAAAGLSVSAALLLAACGTNGAAQKASRDKQVLNLSAAAPLDLSLIHI